MPQQRLWEFVVAPHRELSALSSACNAGVRKEATLVLGKPGFWVTSGLVAQHCDPPYRAIGYSYAYRIHVFQGIAGYRTIMLMF